MCKSYKGNKKTEKREKRRKNMKKAWGNHLAQCQFRPVAQEALPNRCPLLPLSLIDGPSLSGHLSFFFLQPEIMPETPAGGISSLPSIPLISCPFRC
jgi:hypothetical protein